MKYDEKNPKRVFFSGSDTANDEATPEDHVFHAIFKSPTNALEFYDKAVATLLASEGDDTKKGDAVELSTDNQRKEEAAEEQETEEQVSEIDFKRDEDEHPILGFVQRLFDTDEPAANNGLFAFGGDDTKDSKATNIFASSAAKETVNIFDKPATDNNLTIFGAVNPLTGLAVNEDKADATKSAFSSSFMSSSQPVTEDSTKFEDGGDDDPTKFQMLSDEALEELKKKGSAKTGHEDETLIKEVGPAKLYRFVKETGEWKGRGSGQFMFYLSNDGDRQRRVVLRESKTQKLRLNHAVSKEITIKHQNNNPKSWIWTAMDYSDSEGPEDTTFAARFKNEEIAAEFGRLFTISEDDPAASGQSDGKEKEESVDQTDE